MAVKAGDFSVRLPVDRTGMEGKIWDALNEIISLNQRQARELERLSEVVGRQGKLRQRATLPSASGEWASSMEAVNALITHLVQPWADVDRVISAVAKGDLSQSMALETEGRALTGEFQRTAKTVNTMVGQLGTFASEVTRVAREVGTEGKLGGQAQVKGVAGTWKDLTESVNSMASNLTAQVRNIANVTVAVANGDLSRKITVDVRGEVLQLKETINTMVDQLRAFAAEVTRVAREVGTEGRLGGQAFVPGVAGTWKDLTDNVNIMANNLTSQVRNIATVTTAVANGDLTKKITVDVKGEILELKNTINTMVDQLNGFSSEVTRVAREVGTEGKLGGQAEVRGVSGTWKDLTDNVNLMASNLTGQVRNIAEVATAIANGDLAKKITVDVKGEILELKNTLNIMVDQLNAFSSEVTRVAREVGTEGILGGQAQVPGVGGTWKDLTDNVNFMAANLTSQVRNIAEVTTAVANGDLTKKITVDVKGEILELKATINTMVDQLNGFASEVTRVAREVGTEGKLGGQAEVRGVSGTWKDLTDNVNFMAANLTGQVRNIAEVTTAVARGDLTKKITVDVKGEILELKNTINIMVDQLNAFASEVTRVAREVGTEGKLGGQAQVPGVGGTWADLTDNVNFMAANLTSQVRNIAEVTTAVATGDLTKKITVDVKGEILELKNTINKMVDQLNAFSSEVTRVAREVGTEGKLGGQAEVRGVSGTWKDLTDNVNFMAANLTGQVRNIAEVATAIANGDLAKKITVDVKGEILELKNTVNKMVDQLNAFSSEVTRVAREVGTEGKLGGQAQVPGVGGTWKDLTDNVNLMAANLTGQVRNIAEVTTAVATGDLTKKITVDVQGEILELKDTINRMVDQLRAFSSEVTRVAREVGTEGKLGGQAEVSGVSGTWKDLRDNVNLMAANLTGQVRNIAEVATAIANGDLAKRITVDVRGEILQLKDTINTMVDQLRSFAAEVTRVAREVGTEGKLGGQAQVAGVSGTWKDLTDNVNLMASNLTGQVRNIAEVSTAIANGDLTKKITVDVRGEVLQLKETINTMVDQLRAFAAEVTRVAREVGTDGRLGGQAFVPGVGGTWKDLTDNVNLMANNLTGQVRNIATVTTAVANGDLTKKITVDVKGEILELKNTINTMVDQLNAFASEVTRVAREVGTEGKLGGQAEVRGVSGTWKGLTDNVNFMAANLTGQVRGIAKVVTGVAKGDLKQRLSVAAKGEISELENTINDMIDTLATFAAQVTTVAREVGVEGRLGGQAVVPGASGTWKDLTENVNRLAANLTGQVRAIAEVSTAVTKGDLSRTIAVEAAGEVAALKDNINEMIRNLRETTAKSTEQDWLKTNLARFTRMMQGQRDLATVARQLLSELAPVVQMHHGVFYLKTGEHESFLDTLVSYGFTERQQKFRLGEGLVGQCALEKKRILVDEVPAGYATIQSGTGQSAPARLVLLPILFEGEVLAVIELASLTKFGETSLSFLDQLAEIIGIVLNTLSATARTETLLTQSQSLALELQEKAEQVALTSKYKSEFLANVSHELRTPLNSLLILSGLLRDNPEGNLTDKQIEHARTIHNAGQDLLSLINDVLDLSKIESGTVTLEVVNVPLAGIRDDIERAFRPVAEGRRLAFDVAMEDTLPPNMGTDPKRLQQVLKNLLSNAMKFTERGSVSLRISRATGGWGAGHALLDRASHVLAFSVTDTGIGIPPAKQKIIFEAFQQADASTSRRYGGTGLGLAISREIASMLGGSLQLVSSTPGEGSTFTLFVPQPYVPRAARQAEARLMRTGTDSIRFPVGDEPLTAEAADTAVTETAFFMPAGITDDRDQLQPGDRRLLIVEDDVDFAKILLDTARAEGWKGIVTVAAEPAMSLARKFEVDAITLDLQLPEMNGYTLLDMLKHDPATRHMPVTVISIVEEAEQRALHNQAVGTLVKPVSVDQITAAFGRLRGILERQAWRALVVEDDPSKRESIVALLRDDKVQVQSAANGAEALAALEGSLFDLLVLDLGLPDMSGFELLHKLHLRPGAAELPVLLYSGQELTAADEAELKELGLSLLVKHVMTPEALLAEAVLFLHLPEAKLAPARRQMLQKITRQHSPLSGRKVLIVDDDVRNIFAMTSLLERQKLQVVHATNGREGIEMVEKDPTIELVLMDIMMPEMDGYEATRQIRSREEFKNLPIIALTAKAMKGDREKCLEAGATDYVTKPADPDRLMSAMRVSLQRGGRKT
jgi:HAMP domain-containing protein/CheY-like chemotaxis protein/signal transduction histidine kinase